MTKLSPIRQGLHPDLYRTLWRARHQLGRTHGALMVMASLIFGLSLAACNSDSKSPSSDQAPMASGTARTMLDPPFIETGSMQTAVAQRIAESRRAVVDAPTSAEAWGTFGAVCDIHELLTEADVCYRRAMALGGADFRWPYLLAFVLERLGRDRNEPIMLYFQAEALNNRFAPAMFRLGDALANAGRNEEAREAYGRAIAVDSNLAVAHFGLGQVLLQMNEPEEAIERLKRTVEAVSDDGPTWGALAQAYRQTGKHSLASQAANRSRTMKASLKFFDPVRAMVSAQGASSRVAYRRAAQLLASGDLESTRQAIPFLINLEAIQPNDPHVALWRGIAAARLGQIAWADKYFARAIELRETLLANRHGVDLSKELARIDRAHVELCREYLELMTSKGMNDQLKRVLAMFESAVATAPATAVMHVSWGNAVLQLGRTQDAVEHYFKATQIDPSYANGYYNLGFVMEQANRTRDAIAYYQRAALLAPDGPAPAKLKAIEQSSTSKNIAPPAAPE